MPDPRKTAIVIGAGPAGLTAAYMLLKQTDVVPIVLEADGQPGGERSFAVLRREGRAVVYRRGALGGGKWRRDWL